MRYKKIALEAVFVNVFKTIILTNELINVKILYELRFFIMKKYAIIATLLAAFSTFAFAQGPKLEIRKTSTGAGELWLKGAQPGSYYELHTSPDLREPKKAFPAEVTCGEMKIRDINFSKQREFYSAAVQEGFLVVEETFYELNNGDRTVVVDGNDETDDVSVYEIEFRAVGSDIDVDGLFVDFGILDSDSSADLEDMISTVCIEVDGAEIGIENFVDPGNGRIAFSGLDFLVEEDEPVQFTVKVDINEQIGNYENWDGFYVSGIEIPYSTGSGEEYSLIPKYQGGVLSLATHGLILGDVVSGHVTELSPGATQFEFDFDLEAFGDDMYLPGNASIDFEIIGPGSADTTFSLTSNADRSGSHFTLEEADSEGFRFMLIIHNVTAPGFYEVRINSIRFQAGSTSSPVETTPYFGDVLSLTGVVFGSPEIIEH